MLRLHLVEMKTGCILHVIHVAVTWMKQSGINGLSRVDILKGMMTVQNLLGFIPLNDSADEISGGRLVSWITSWCKLKTGTVWGVRPLKKLAPDDFLSCKHNTCLGFGHLPQQRWKLWFNYPMEIAWTPPYPPHVCYTPFDDTPVEKATIQGCRCVVHC